MERAVLILGMLAALLALGLGLFGVGFGAAMASRGFQAAVVLVPIILAVGAGLALVAPGFASLTLLVGVFGLLYSFGFNLVTALPVLLATGTAGIAAVMAFRQGLPTEAPESEPTRPQLSGGNPDRFLP